MSDCNCLVKWFDQITYLSAGSRNFIDNISEYDVLITGFDADLLPLHVLTQADIIAKKWVRYTKIYNKFTKKIK